MNCKCLAGLLRDPKAREIVAATAARAGPPPYSRRSSGGGPGGTGRASRRASTAMAPADETITGLMSSSAISGTASARRATRWSSSSSAADVGHRGAPVAEEQGGGPQRADQLGGVGVGHGQDPERAVTQQLGRRAPHAEHQQRPEQRVLDHPDDGLHAGGGHLLDEGAGHRRADPLGHGPVRVGHLVGGGEVEDHATDVALVDDLGPGRLEGHGEPEFGGSLTGGLGPVDLLVPDDGDTDSGEDVGDRLGCQPPSLRRRREEAVDYGPGGLQSRNRRGRAWTRAAAVARWRSGWRGPGRGPRARARRRRVRRSRLARLRNPAGRRPGRRRSPRRRSGSAAAGQERPGSSPAPAWGSSPTTRATTSATSDGGAANVGVLITMTASIESSSSTRRSACS